MAQRFRKKPIVIEAMQFRRDDTGNAILEWANKGLLPSDKAILWIVSDDGTGSTMWVATLEGIMVARDGDWIIKGIKGEFYPCKSDIFEATYESVY